MKTKLNLIKVIANRDSIVKKGTPLEVVNAGFGAFRIVKSNGHFTDPMTLFIRVEDFDRVGDVPEAPKEPNVTFRAQRCASPEGQAVTEHLFGGAK